MDEWTQIRTGSRAEIKVDVAGVGTSFNTKVEKIGEKAIALSMPTQKKALSLLKKGIMAEVLVTQENYNIKFVSEIVNRRPTPTPVLILARPRKVERIQKRSFYRIDVQIPAQYRLMKDEITPISEFRNAATKDLSGGGLMLVVDRPLKEDSLVEVNLDLGQEQVNILGDVKICKNRQEGDRTIFEVGVKFLIMPELEQDKIVRFINQKQQELRRRGLM